MDVPAREPSAPHALRHVPVAARPAAVKELETMHLPVAVKHPVAVG